MTDPEQQSREERPVLSRLGWLLLAVTLPLAGAALLWWIPGSRAETIWVSIGVMVLALAGWRIWRDE